METAKVVLRSGRGDHVKDITGTRADILRFGRQLARACKRQANNKVLVHFADESAPVKIRA